MQRLNIAAILIIVSVSQVFAQGDCGAERKIPTASGIVLLTNGIPVTQTTVELHENDADGRIIATTETDSAGHFVFPNVKAGKYVIKVNPSMIPPAYVKIRVTLKSLPKNRRVKLAIIMFGTIEDFCGGGYSELREYKIK